MLRTHRIHRIDDPSGVKNALLEWARGRGDRIWLDSNGHHDRYSSFEACLALGQEASLGDLESLKVRMGTEKDWWFGHFSYELKDRLEDLVSSNGDGIGFPELHFFRPRKLIFLKGDRLHFHYLKAYEGDLEADLDALLAIPPGPQVAAAAKPTVAIKMRIHKEAYFEKVGRFLEHIQRGDIYEANFCQEFYAVPLSIDPLDTYKRLNAISEPPFAAFMALGPRYLMCASPERYLRKQGQKVVSQPIKGTAPRGRDREEDLLIRERLEADEKERAENLMITDLVRNDLSKSAIKGSVRVEELCKVYGFKQVNQMISTISAEVAPDQDPVDLIRESFPMGSMTGAPKVSAMRIIEALEESKRGLYSGALGYFDPQGNFDFNVVIRSILYNASKKYVSYSVGSAITAKSDPDREYQECLLKAKAMRSVLGDSGA